MSRIRNWIIVCSSLLLFTLGISLYISFLPKGEPFSYDDLVFESKTFVYDGASHSLEVTGELPKGLEITYENNKHIDVGEYEVIAHILWKGKEYPIKRATLTIEPSSLKGITFQNRTVTYTGKEHSIFIEGMLPKDVEVTYENNGQINAGSYQVFAKFFSANPNYKLPSSLEATLTIKKAIISLDDFIFADKTVYYDGTKKSLQIEGDLPNEIEITYENNAQVSVGEYEVTAHLKDTSGNYEIIEEVKAHLSIKKGLYDMSLVSFHSLEIPYDGLEHQILIAGELPLGVSVLRYENNIRKDVGVSIARVYFQGDYVNFEEIPYIEATLTISLGDMSFLIEKEIHRTYTGQLQTFSYSNLPEGIVADYKEESYLDAGTYEIEVKFKDTLGRYKDLNEICYFVIDKASYDISNLIFEDKTFIYDGSPHNLEIVGTLPQGVSVSYSNNTLTNVGRILVTASFHILDSKNYQSIPSFFAYLTIVPMQLEGISLPDASFTYDGNAHGLTLLGTLPAGVTAEIENNNQIEVGVYEVIVHFNIENYASLKGTLTITKANIDMSSIFFYGQTFVYDGNEHGIYIEGSLSDLVIVRYENNKRTEVGSQTATAIFEVLDRKHYNDIPNLYAELVIISNQITGISFKDKTVTYNQLIQSIYIEGELPEGVTVTYENNEQKNVGVYEVIAKFHDSTGIYGNLSDMKATLTILKATYAKNGIIFADKSFVYDGLPHSLEIICDDLPTDIEVVYQNNNQINAGGYEVIVSFIDALGNYNEVESRKATLTILRRKIDDSLLVFENQEFEYDGFEHTLMIQGVLPEGVKVKYSANSLTELGRILVTATFIVDEDNIEPIPSKMAYLTITKGALENVSLQDKSFVYTGESYFLEVEGDIPLGVTVEYQNNGHSEVGVYFVEVWLYDSEGYYNSLSAKLTILFAKYDMSGITFKDETYTYDGNEHTLCIEGELPKGVTVAYSRNTLINAGSLLVTATFTGDPNYEAIPSMQATLTINKIKIEGVSLESKEFLYDGNYHHIEIQGIEEYPVSAYYYNNEHRDVGSYEVIVTLVLENENYMVDQTWRAILTILPVPYEEEIIFTDQTFILDGKPHSLKTSSLLPEGMSVVYENNDQIYEGSYIVTMRFVGDKTNYILPEPKQATLTIVSDGSYHMVVFCLGDGTEERFVVKNNEGISNIPLPATKEGYEGSYEGDFTHITSKMVLGPIYTPKHYTITLEGTELAPLEVVYLEPYSLPTPTKDNYSFKKWQDADGNSFYAGTYTWTDNITIYAIWQCQVKIQNKYGHIYEEITLDENTYVEPKYAYSQSFEGFYEDEDLTIPFSLNTAITENKILYVKYVYDFDFSIEDDAYAVVEKITNPSKRAYDFLELIYDVYPIQKLKKNIFAQCNQVEEISLPVLEGDFGTYFGTEISDYTQEVEQRTGLYYIPKSLKTVRVKTSSIPLFSFMNCQMIETIDLNVETIEAYALQNCIGIREVHLHGSPQINENAFENCTNIQKVNADSLESWSKISFKNVLSTPMYYGNTLCTEIDSTTELVLEDEIIGPYQFYGVPSLTEVSLPNTTTIGTQAFMNCQGLQVVRFGESLAKLSNDCFALDEQLKKVYYASTLANWNHVILENKYATPMRYATNFYSLENTEYAEMTKLTINDGENVGNYQYLGFRNIAEIDLNQVETIGEYAFEGLENVSTLSLSNQIKALGVEAFENTHIATIYFDGLIEEWSQIRFSSAKSTPLWSDISHLTFTQDSVKVDFIVINGINQINPYQFYGFKDTISIEITSPIASIGTNAFMNCRSLEEITICPTENFVSYENAFLGCENLHSAEYLCSIEDYQNITFKNNAASPLYYGGTLVIASQTIEELSLTKNVKAYQFYGVNGLRKVSFTEDVKRIETAAFSNCVSLETLVNLESITGLGDSVFANDARLTEINLPHVEIIPTSCFSYCESLTQVIIPKVITIESNAFIGCKALEQVDLPLTQKIQASAFKGCNSLKSLTLPSIQQIGREAFASCVSLNEVVIPASIQMLEAHIFRYCLAIIVYIEKEELGKWDALCLQGIDYYLYSETKKDGKYWHYDELGKITLWN